MLQKAISEALRRAPQSGAAPLLVDFFDEWLERFPRHPRTQQTNSHPPLPPAQRSLSDHRTPEGVATACPSRATEVWPRQGGTIDGAFTAFSAMLRDAVDVELLDGNPAHGIRVRPNDPRLNPVRTPTKRRAVPAEEVGAFMRRRTPDTALCAGPPSSPACARVSSSRSPAPTWIGSSRCCTSTRPSTSTGKLEPELQDDPPRTRPRAQRSMDALPGEPDPHDRVGSRRHRRTSLPVAARVLLGPPQLLPERSGSRRSWHRRPTSRSTTHDTRSRRDSWPRGSR